MGLFPNLNNWNQIGSGSLYWYRAYINNYYGNNSHITNWDAGKNIGTAATSSAAATKGSVNFYNTAAAGTTQTKTLLEANSATSANVTITLPSSTGNLALISDIPTKLSDLEKDLTYSDFGAAAASHGTHVTTATVKSALGTVSTTAKKFLKDTGDWVQVAYTDLTGVPTSFTPAEHDHNTLYPLKTSTTITKGKATKLTFTGEFQCTVGVTTSNSHARAYYKISGYGQSDVRITVFELADSPQVKYYIPDDEEAIVFCNQHANSVQALFIVMDHGALPTITTDLTIPSSPNYLNHHILTEDNYKSYAWARPSSITAGQVLISNGTTGDTTLRAILDNTSAGALGWNTAGNTHADNLRLIDVNTLAYWNGAFNGTYSNLAYYKGGAFGTMAKETAADYAKLVSPAFSGTPTAPTAANGTSTTQIATTEFVNNTLAYANAMTFKGTLGTDGTVTALPASHNAGDTYRVITADTWAGKYCEVGTLIICVKDGTAAADADWTSVETNEDGAVIGATPTSSTDNAIVRWNGTSGRIIQNSSTVLQDDGTIKFAQVTSTSYPANSAGLSWSGDNDGASIYYSQRASNSGHLVLQTTDDSNETIIFRHTRKADSNNYDGVIISPYYAQIYPKVNAQGSVGISDSRWANGYYSAHLYIGPTTYTAYNSNETGTYIEPGGIGLSNTTAQRGYYLRGGDTQYSRWFINTIGTASTAESSSGANDGTAGTLGNVILELGNNIANVPKNTAGGAHNARGLIRFYGNDTAFTQVVSNLRGSASYNFWLPNYAGDQYATHVGSTSTVGSDIQPVYVAANGRVTAGQALWQKVSKKSTELYDFGVYVAQNTGDSSSPTGNNYYTILNVPYRKATGNTKADYGFQIGNKTDNDNRLWYRTSGSGVWGEWQTIAHATQSATAIGGQKQPVYMAADGTITAGTALKNLAYKDSLVASDIPDISGTYLSLSGGTLTGHLSVCNGANPSKNANAATIEIREATRGGADIEHIVANAPRLGFHWGSHYWGQLVLYDAAFRFYDSTLTNYYPVYASTFYGELSGNATTATSSKVLANLYGNYGIGQSSADRPDTANIAHVINGGVTHFKVTSKTNATGKPMGDGNILHFHWDTSAAWDSQLYIPDSSGNSMQWRGSSAAGTWDSWRTLLDNENYSSYGIYSTNLVSSADLTNTIGTINTRWGGIHSGYLQLSGPSSAPSDSAGARIIFSYDSSTTNHNSQPVILAYTPNDSYRAPYGLKLFGTDGNSAGAWFETTGDIISGKNLTVNGTSTLNGNTTISAATPVLQVKSTGTNAATLGLIRNGLSSWQWVNSGGNLYLQNNWDGASGKAVNYFNVVTYGHTYGTVEIHKNLAVGGTSTFSDEATLTKANGGANFGIYVNHTNPNSDTSKAKKIGLMVGGATGSGGVYDVTKGKWIVYSDTAGDVTLNGNALTATTATSAGSATKSGVTGLWLYPENNNEINFGGTNTSTTMYFGYRAKDSRAIPTKFIFGGSTGTADLQAKTVYLGSGTTSYISSTQYTGNAATATKLTYTNISKMSDIGDISATRIYVANSITDPIDGMTTGTLLNVGGGNGYYRAWQIWNQRNDSLRWRTPLGDASDWGTIRVILDTANTTIPSTVPTLSWGADATVLTINGSAVKIKAMAKPTAADIGAATSTHTHNYAGSSSAGGSATSAVKLDGGLATNDISTYTNLKLTTAKGGYYGFLVGNSTSCMNVMGAAQHNGLYCQAHGRWITYYDATNDRIAIGSATTKSGYVLAISGKTHINDATTVNGTISAATITLTNTGATSHIDFSRTGGHTAPNYINVPTGSALAVSVGGAAGTNIAVMVENKSVNSFNDAETSLGTSTYEWKETYSKNYVVGKKVKLEYNSTDDSLDFIFI